MTDIDMPFSVAHYIYICGGVRDFAQKFGGQILCSSNSFLKWDCSQIYSSQIKLSFFLIKTTVFVLIRGHSRNAYFERLLRKSYPYAPPLKPSEWLRPRDPVKASRKGPKFCFSRINRFSIYRDTNVFDFLAGQVSTWDAPYAYGATNRVLTRDPGGQGSRGSPLVRVRG